METEGIAEPLFIQPNIVDKGSWASRMQERFRSILQREPRRQTITLGFHFAPHKRGEDLETMKTAFEQCDIFIPEIAGWTPENLRTLRAASEGKMTVEKVLEYYSGLGSHIEGLYRFIQGSHKPIALIDIPAGHPLNARHDRQWSQSPYDHDILLRQSFPNAIKITKRFMKNSAEIQKQREDYMLSQLAEVPSTLGQIYPNIRKKPNLNILINLGSFHTGVFHDLQQKGLSSRRQFNAKPLIFDAHTQGVRGYYFGKEVSDIVAARSLLEHGLYADYEWFLSMVENFDTEKTDTFTRRIFESFNLEDIHILFDQIKRTKKVDREQLLLDVLQQRGFTIPQTEEELDACLSSR